MLFKSEKEKKKGKILKQDKLNEQKVINMVDINPTTLLIISNSTGSPSVNPVMLWPSCCAKDVCFFMKAFVFAYTFALSRFVCLFVYPSFQYSLQDSGCVCVMRRFSIFLTWVLRLHFSFGTEIFCYGEFQPWSIILMLKEFSCCVLWFFPFVFSPLASCTVPGHIKSKKTFEPLQ